MKSNETQRERLLSALAARAPRAVHVAELCGDLGLDKSDRDEIEEALGKLVEAHVVTEMPGGRYRLAKGWKEAAASLLRSERPSKPLSRSEQHASRETQGRLVMTTRGFGFVAALDDGGDVFIPPPSVGGGMHGDLVVVSTRPSQRGREGDVIRVLERATNVAVGVLRRRADAEWLEPIDPRTRGPMPLALPPPNDARDGLVCVATITKYPTRADEAPIVEITRVLGASGVAAVEVEALKIREGVVEPFPPEVGLEAAHLPKVVDALTARGREDFRDLPLVTIDPPDARDHDDAVYVERREDGTYRVVVAIADVSFYVRTGTALDKEALRRGTSIYLPDRAIPMLPPELSTHLASLVPDEDRLMLGIDADLDTEGHVRRHRFVRGVMRSRGKLHYGGVAYALGLTSDASHRQLEANAHLEALRALQDLAKLRRAQRTKRGSLDFDLPEPRVKFDPKTQEPVDVYRSRQDPGVRQAYSMIEEMMLLANEVVAQDLGKRGWPVIYRVHGAPDEDKLATFAEVARSLGYQLDADAGQFPRKLQRFLRKIEGTPHAQALGYLLLRAMQQATYDTTNIGHFGLAAKDYLHFTSPIRRYPDLAVHRVVHMLLDGERPNFDQLRSTLHGQAVESSRLERRAMQLEREAIDLYRAILMRERIGEVFDATISGVASHGFYVQFDSPFVEALCPVGMLGDDFYELDEHGLRLSGNHTGRTFSLGDRVRVEVVDVNVSRREIAIVPEGTKVDARNLPRPGRNMQPLPGTEEERVTRGPRRTAVPAWKAREDRPFRFGRREDEQAEHGGQRGHHASDARPGGHGKPTKHRGAAQDDRPSFPPRKRLKAHKTGLSVSHGGPSRPQTKGARKAARAAAGSSGKSFSGGSSGKSFGGGSSGKSFGGGSSGKSFSGGGSGKSFSGGGSGKSFGGGSSGKSFGGGSSGKSFGGGGSGKSFGGGSSGKSFGGGRKKTSGGRKRR